MDLYHNLKQFVSVKQLATTWFLQNRKKLEIDKKLNWLQMFNNFCD